MHVVLTRESSHRLAVVLYEHFQASGTYFDPQLRCPLRRRGLELHCIMSHIIVRQAFG